VRRGDKGRSLNKKKRQRYEVGNNRYVFGPTPGWGGSLKEPSTERGGNSKGPVGKALALGRQRKWGAIPNCINHRARTEGATHERIPYETQVGEYQPPLPEE